MNGMAEACATVCGVTLQAQNSATSPVGMPLGGAGPMVCARSVMPMASGSPMCIGAPCVAWNREVTCTARATFAAGKVCMVTTIGPAKRPAGLHMILVLYNTTPTELTHPASARACKKVRLDPKKKATKSSCHNGAISVTSSTNSPSRQTEYSPTSWRISAPGASVFGVGQPGSVTSSSGHGCGLRWQKTRKS